MKFKRKWMYVWAGMCLGCIFTLMGFILATAVQDVAAQEGEIGSVKFDTIVCRRLNIVDDTGKPLVELGIIDKGGVVTAHGKEGDSYSHLSHNEHGGFVKVDGKHGLSYAVLGISEQGGHMLVKDKAGRTKYIAP